MDAPQIIDNRVESPLLRLDVDTWLHIASYLTCKSLNVLWESSRQLRVLFRQLKYAPLIALQPRHLKWPPWISHRLTHLNIYTPFHNRSLFSYRAPTTHPLTDTQYITFWREAMQVWPTSTLESLDMNLNYTATVAFLKAWECIPTARDDCASSSQSQNEITTTTTIPYDTPSPLDALRLKFPHLTTLRLTGERRVRTLSDWLLGPTQHAISDSDLAIRLASLKSAKGVTTPFYTLHLKKLRKYHSNTPLLLQYLPRTLTDLKLSFGKIQHEDEDDDEEDDDDNDDLTRPSKSSLQYMWDEQAITALPRHLVHLSLSGVPPHLLTPELFASLQELETLQLVIGNNPGILVTQIAQQTSNGSLYALSPLLLSQLPPNLHTLELKGPYKQLVAYMKHLPDNNNLTALILRGISSPSNHDKDHHLKHLIEYIVSNAKFQRLEILHVWLYFESDLTRTMPSLKGMKCMRQLRSISPLFVRTELYEQWREHLPLPTEGKLRVAKNHKQPWHTLVIDHFYGYDAFAKELLTKLKGVDTIHWATSHSSVQLPPQLASSIRNVCISSDNYRNQWDRHRNKSRELPLESVLHERCLNFAQSIQHLPNVENIDISFINDVSFLKDLTRPLESLNGTGFHIDISPIQASCFGFDHSTWASRLVKLRLSRTLIVEDATNFMLSLPPTLKTLSVSIIFENDWALLNDAYVNNFEIDYASANPEMRLKREIRFLPPQLIECYLSSCYVYITEATIRCMPKSLRVMDFTRMLDLHLDPSTLLELPPNLSKCFIGSTFCSHPNLSTSTLEAITDALWRRLPALSSLQFELSSLRVLNTCLHPETMEQ